MTIMQCCFSECDWVKNGICTRDIIIINDRCLYSTYPECSSVEEE